MIRCLSATFYICLCAVCLLVADLPTHAQSKNRKKSKNKKTKVLSDQDQQRVQKMLFDGMSAKLKDNKDQAIAAYKACLEIDANNDVAMYELAQLYLEGGNKLVAMGYAQGAAEIAPENKWYQYLYADILAGEKQFDQAAVVYQQLIDRNPNSVEEYFDLIQLEILAGKYESAIKTLDKLENKIGVGEETTMKKQELYFKLGKEEEALKEAQKLLETDKSNPSHYHNLAILYEKMGQSDKAFSMYQKMVEIAPKNPYARLALADYYRLQKNDDKYFEELTLAFEHPDLPLETKARILSVYLQEPTENEKLKKQIFDIVKKVAEVHDNDALGYALYGDLLNTYNQKIDALEVFKKAASVDKKRYEVWEQILWLNFELRDFQGLQEDSQATLELFPNQVMPYYFKGLAEKRLENYDASVKALKRAAIINADNPQLGGQIYSLLGETYNDIKDYKKSDQSYEKALASNPENVTVLNNYSYFLSLRGDRLEDAASMALKANTLKPNESSYQDTYGWILFMQKKYTDAEEWLGKAIANGGDTNGVILEHYGDTLFKLKKTDKAVEYWQMAKDMGSDSKLLDRKIKDRQFY
ncbi:MAG: tetratricopeptide repeat protein [Chitinophagales bacterium]